MGLFAFSGRLLFSAIFIISGVSKLTSYDSNGGPMVSVVAPKMDCFLESIEGLVPGLDLPTDTIKENYGYLILGSGILEVLGGVLFILDVSVGALFLMLFLIGVTPIMHNFWDSKCCSEGDQVPEMVNFLKNLSIFGGLFAYVFKVGKYQRFKVKNE